MLLSIQVQELDGIADVGLFMGTAVNKKRLENADYPSEEFESAGAYDLIIALDVKSEDSFQSAIQKIESFLADGRALARTQTGEQPAVLPRSLESAISTLFDPDLVSISLPGEYAGKEARKALLNGLHVFLFSDNVPLEEEISLKQLAWDKGLLLMGPDCGTARIGRHCLGFCNEVEDGEVGIVAASGTGAQEVMTLLSRRGIGISHVIGTGGRDLYKEIGGVSSLMGLKALDEDPQTRVILYISKPADPEARAKLASAAGLLTKPLIVCFIGEKYTLPVSEQSLKLAANLDHAARWVAALLANETPPLPQTIEDFYSQNKERISKMRSNLNDAQRSVRGLYSGGSLADEAALILAQFLPEVRAGNGFENVLPIAGVETGPGNRILDLGDDRYTQGRPHPMIDTRLRLEVLRTEAQDPSVGVVLFDVVLGLNAHPDPAADLARAISQIKSDLQKEGREVHFLAHVCGTEHDPQSYSGQVEQLEQAGCWVLESNAKAAMATACLLIRGLEKDPLFW